MRKNSAKTKNGATPSQCVGHLKPAARACVSPEMVVSVIASIFHRGWLFHEERNRAAGSRPVDTMLLYVGADHRIPVLGDLGGGGLLLFEAREHGLRVERRVRQLGQKFLRNLVVLGQVVEADRMAVAGEPADLAFV